MNIKNEFPIFKEYPNLVYLDNAATTQKPNILISSISEYYTKYNSNIGRGAYSLANLSEEKYLQSKEKIKKFFNASKYNTIFTSGSTESLNLSKHIISQFSGLKGKYIVIPFCEHHANILVWQQLAKTHDMKIYWLKNAEEISNVTLIPEEIKNSIAIIAITHISNVTGEILPIHVWIKFAKEIGAISVIDGSQSVASEILNINEIDCDFFVFSAHKIYGPMGLGVLFMKNTNLDYLPLKLGGGIVENVTFNSFELINDVAKYEAGTPNVANAYSFGETLDWLSTINFRKLLEKTHKLNSILNQKLLEISINPILISPQFEKTHISSFNLKGIHPHDVGTFLSSKNIAVRVGKHCAYPLHETLGINSSVRASVAIYNDEDDIEKLVHQLKMCLNYFKD